MIKKLFALSVWPAPLLLTGCGIFFGDDGYFRDRGNEYLKAEPSPVIAAPEESRARLQEIYVVPEIDDAGYDYSQEFEVPRPQAVSSAMLEDKVKIQRLSGDAWITVTNSPAEVWPLVREFLGSRSLSVAKADATSGLIETHWLAFNDTPELRDRFRIRIENGVQPDSSEIHILHMNEAAEGEISADTSWPSASTDASREAWMIDELSNTLASNLERSSSSLLAQTIGGDSKAYLDATDTGEPVLRLRLSYVRAWASLLGGVDDEGYFLWDRENTLGVIYVSYEEPADEDDEPGWFGRLLGKGKHEDPETPYTVLSLLERLPDTAQTREIFSKTQSTGERLKEVPGYLLIVRGVDQDIEVRIRDGYAQRLADKEAKRLLGVLRNNLI